MPWGEEQPGQVLTVALSSNLPAVVGLMLEPCPPRPHPPYLGFQWDRGVHLRCTQPFALLCSFAHQCLRQREGQAEEGRERTNEPHRCLFIALMKVSKPDTWTPGGRVGLPVPFA